MTNRTKKSILAVSFGTAHRATDKSALEVIEKRIAEHFPEYEVRRVFTSEIVRKILEERDGIHVDNLQEALENLWRERFREVIVQPLHIICGEEYQKKVLQVVAKYTDAFDKILVGDPLLTKIEDYEASIEALKAQLPSMCDGRAVALIGHGSIHPANASYACLQLLLQDELPHVYVGTVEGYPDFDYILRKLKSAKIKEVVLMPFMLVAGEHVHHDLLGGHDESWKTVLEREGFKVYAYLHGLGENLAYQEIYIQHIKRCLT